MLDGSSVMWSVTSRCVSGPASWPDLHQGDERASKVMTILSRSEGLGSIQTSVAIVELYGLLRFTEILIIHDFSIQFRIWKRLKKIAQVVVQIHLTSVYNSIVL